MNLNELVKTIHHSIDDVNKEHTKWTGGWWVTAYGVESYIVSGIARGIMGPGEEKRSKYAFIKNPPTYATMETRFTEIYASNDAIPKGASCGENQGNRLDLCLYTGNKPTHALELKRFWEPGCLRDLDRLCSLLEQFGTAQGGSLQAGVFVLLATAKSRQPGKVKARQSLDEAFKRYTDECSEHLKKWLNNGLSSYDFSRGTEFIEPTLLDDGQSFSSFCVVLQ